MAQVPDYVQPTPKMRPDRESIDRASLAQTQDAVDDGTANKVVDMRAFTPKSAKAVAAKLPLATRCGYTDVKLTPATLKH
eukprot:4983038-Amphidinium_carterae.1